MSTIVTGANINGFYQLDNTVLKFDLIKDIEKIQLNHLIMQKENLTRLIGNLPKGQFNTSIHEVAHALNITKNKATRLLKEFTELGIISLVKKGTSKNTLSVYRYNSVTTEDAVNIVVDADANVDAKSKAEEKPNQNKSTRVNSVNDIDFIQCQLMDKIDLCSEYGINLECNDEELHILETLQDMDIDGLKICLELAKAKNNSNFNYVLGIYFNKGYDLDHERELSYGEYIYNKRVEEMKARIEKTRAEREIVEPLVEPVAVEPMVEETVEEIVEPSVEAPTTSINDITVKTGADEGFDFSRDVIGMETYKKILNGNTEISESSLKYAQNFAITYNLDTSVIDAIAV